MVHQKMPQQMLRYFYFVSCISVWFTGMLTQNEHVLAAVLSLDPDIRCANDTSVSAYDSRGQLFIQLFKINHHPLRNHRLCFYIRNVDR